MRQPSQEPPLPESQPVSGAQQPDEPLRLLHHHPGYLRVQADAFIQAAEDCPALRAAQSAAEAVPGVLSFTHVPRTGSLVIEYEPADVESDDLLLHIARSAGLRGVVDARGHKRNRQELVGAFLDAVQGVNRVVSRVAAERADLRELVPIALAATSVVSFVLNEDRGRLPTWDSALYHSYRIFMQWHRPEVRAREKVARQEEEREPPGSKRGGAR